MISGRGRIPDYVFEDKTMEKTAQRDISIDRDEPFREPDQSLGGTWAVWYGPGGPEGDHATEVTVTTMGWEVAEYTNARGLIEPHAREGIYLVVTRTIEEDDIINNYSVAEDELEIDEVTNPTLSLRWAARAGVDFIANFGGEETWADELPK